MKRIFTISSILVLVAVLLGACTKRGYYGGGNEEDYWLSRENGVVVYSDGYCPYYVIETYDGYTVVRSTAGQMPFEGDEIFGDLSRHGYMDLYNYSDGTIIRGQVTDYWLTYSEAQYIIDNLCYTYGRSAEKKSIQQGLLKKKVMN